MKKGILEYVSLRRYLSAGVYTGPVYKLAFYVTVKLYCIPFSKTPHKLRHG